MRLKRQEERRLQNDTSYRLDTSYRGSDGNTVKVYNFNGVRGNMSSGGSALAHEWAPASAGRASRFSTGYADRRYSGVGGVSAGAADRVRRGYGGRAGERTAEGSVSGELRRRRTVSRAPDMSKPRARRAAPSVSLGDVRRAPAAVKTKVAEPRIHTIPQTERKPFPIAFIFTAFVCSFLFMYMIYNIVRINEYTIDISKLKSRLGELTTVQNELTLKLEKKNDLVEIERIATQEYGMVKRDKVAKQYVNVGDGDVIEAETRAEGEASADGLSSLMSAISTNFGDVLG
jgi:cell division protein FtsB